MSLQQVWAGVDIGVVNNPGASGANQVIRPAVSTENSGGEASA